MTQLQLCATPTQVPADNKRPTNCDPTVAPAVAEKLLPAVVAWLKETDGLTDEDIPDVHEQLQQALEDADCDGYCLSKSLEDNSGWTPDSQLVEILDSAGHYESDVVEALVYQWLVANQMQPEHCVGDQVQVRGGFRHPNKIFTGTITEIDAKQGRYVIFIPEMGHVPKGQVGTQGVYIAWEEIDKGVIHAVPHNSAV